MRLCLSLITFILSGTRRSLNYFRIPALKNTVASLDTFVFADSVQ